MLTDVAGGVAQIQRHFQLSFNENPTAAWLFPGACELYSAKFRVNLPTLDDISFPHQPLAQLRSKSARLSKFTCKQGAEHDSFE